MITKFNYVLRKKNKQTFIQWFVTQLNYLNETTVPGQVSKYIQVGGGAGICKRDIETPNNIRQVAG